MTENFSLVSTFSLLLPLVGAAAVVGQDVDSGHLNKRQCSQCPSEVKATCPQCPQGSFCSLSIDACGCTKAMCMNGSGQLQEPPAKPNSGAIGGGIAAAVLVLSIAGFLIWRTVKTKRKLRAEAEAKEKFDSLRSARHSQASIATTASNVIQIGFIPGVNGRSGPPTPGFIPPVPAIPNGLGTPTIRYPQSPAEGTFFSAEDILRASVYTTGTVDHDPRASVATTIYRNNAVVQPVAANVIRAGKANVVQVKGAGSATSTPHLGSAPPIPEIDPSHFTKSHLEPVPPSPAFSVGSTFLNKMSERNQETEEKKPEKQRLSPLQRRLIPGRSVQAVAEVTDSTIWDETDDDEPKHRRQTMNSRLSATTNESEDSPFSDTRSLSNIPLPAENGLPPITSSQKPSRRTETQSGADSTVSQRRMSPFDDSNAVDRSKVKV